MTTTSPNSSTRKRNKWGRIWLYALLLTFVLLIGLSIWLTVAGNPKDQFRISPETTVLVEPLTADGLVDYAEAIRRRNREEVPPEQNAARLLLAAIGPQAFNNDEEARQAYEQLEMEPLPEVEESRYRASHYEFIKKLCTESAIGRERFRFITDGQISYCLRYPWSTDDAPEIAAWIAANEVPLEKVHAASRLPHCRNPVYDSNVPLLTMMLPSVQTSRDHVHSAARCEHGTRRACGYDAASRTIRDFSILPMSAIRLPTEPPELQQAEIAAFRAMTLTERGHLLALACRAAARLNRSRIAAGLPEPQPEPWPESTWRFLAEQTAHART